MRAQEKSVLWHAPGSVSHNAVQCHCILFLVAISNVSNEFHHVCCLQHLVQVVDGC